MFRKTRDTSQGPVPACNYRPSVLVPGLTLSHSQYGLNGSSRTQTEPSFMMTTQITLSIALLAALSSNVTLLVILLVKSSNVAPSNQSPETLHQAMLGASSRSGFIDGRMTPDDGYVLNRFPATPQRRYLSSVSRDGYQDYTNDDLLLLRLLQNQLLQSVSPWQAKEHDYLKDSDSDEERDDVNNLPSNWKYAKQPYRTPAREEAYPPRPIFRDRDLASATQAWGTPLPTRATNVRVRPINGGSVPEELTDHFSINDLLDYRNSRNLTQWEPPGRRMVVRRDRRDAEGLERREAVAATGKDVAGGDGKLRTHEVFSGLTDSELARFEPAIYDVLIPALVHLETMIIREFDSLHSIVVSHDLRLEKLEQSMLNLRGSIPEPQSDSADNKSQPDIPSQIIGVNEGLLPAGNSSDLLELSIDVEGSGDSQWTLTKATSSPRPTTVHNVAFYDMYRILGTLEQKVMSLENYNVMSDSELTRVRSEVVKMDDKVTELDRQQRNLQIRTSMHTQKITELEVYMSKSELGIHTALDSYSRINSRLDTFKDKLSEFKNDLKAVAVQFGHHDQITNELRAADSYKAHDIQEVRKSVFSIEGRLGGLYQVLDHNLDTVRTDLRAMLDRLCTNNKLSC